MLSICLGFFSSIDILMENIETVLNGKQDLKVSILDEWHHFFFFISLPLNLHLFSTKLQLETLNPAGI